MSHIPESHNWCPSAQSKSLQVSLMLKQQDAAIQVRVELVERADQCVIHVWIQHIWSGTLMGSGALHLCQHSRMSSRSAGSSAGTNTAEPHRDDGTCFQRVKTGFQSVRRFYSDLNLLMCIKRLEAALLAEHDNCCLVHPSQRLPILHLH